MSKFIGKLQVELIDDTSNDGRGSWRLTEAFGYQSDIAGQTFIVPVGFVTDFASVPRLPIAFWLFGDDAHEAAVIHDFLYKTKPVDRSLADKVLKEASGVSGIPAWRCLGMYLGVRIGGGKPWEDDTLAQS